MSQHLTIEQVAAISWDLMKPDDDPLFHICSIDHQQKLVYHAQNVKSSGIANDEFERQVKEVLADPERERLRLADKWAVPKEEVQGEIEMIAVSPQDFEIKHPENIKTNPAKPKTKKAEK